jgi:GTP cyclohydrolase II
MDGGQVMTELETDVARVRTSVDISLQTSGGRVVGRVSSFDGLFDGREHVAVALGLPRHPPAVPLVRLHSECLTGEVFGSEQCDCGPQLSEAMHRIEQVGGYLLYLRQEGRGIGLYAKLDAYRLQAEGLDTFEANRALGYRDDERDYTAAAQMLHALGVAEVDLLTNNYEKIDQLTALGIAVRRRVPTGLFATPSNGRYLAAKAAVGQHGFDVAAALSP